MAQFYLKCEINLMKIELEIKPVILRLSRKAMKFLGNCSIQEVLKWNKVSFQLKNQSLSVHMGNKNSCLLLNAHIVNLGACL